MSHTPGQLRLSILPDLFAVCRLDKDAPVPGWCLDGFFCVARTHDELSVVCRQSNVPAGTTCERGWRCFQVEGPLHFELTGILAAATTPLANAGVSMFAFSTYDTDYFLVRDHDLAAATEALSRAGHQVAHVS